MTTAADGLKAALDRMLAAEDPAEKARLREEFDRLFRAAMARTTRTFVKSWADGEKLLDGFGPRTRPKTQAETLVEEITAVIGDLRYGKCPKCDREYGLTSYGLVRGHKGSDGYHYGLAPK